MQAIVAQMERQTGYRIDRHRLELYGTCPPAARARLVILIVGLLPFFSTLSAASRPSGSDIACT